MEDKCRALEMRGRSRRRLDVSSPPKKSKSECEPMPSTSYCSSNSLDKPDHDLSVSNKNGSGESNMVDRRLTRSASKRWLKIYESNAQNLRDGVCSTSDKSMLPPPQPVAKPSQPSASGAITRLRNRTQGNRAGNDVHKMSQSFFQRLSFDQISNTSDYGTASEHSRKCSVASGGMSPVSDSGNSCHCASISGIESLGTSSGDETPPHISDLGWNMDKPWDSESSVLPKPKVTAYAVDGVTAFIPDQNKSLFDGDFKVTIKNHGHEKNMYR
ncbi:Protein YIPF5 [Frankliniella fusca]|uniref:Protein YIPF5 n=1 Tax=Frankliniella fusca TaxID=407009 RepID=A0AAE1LSC4_9NEOP|nr:Protein YIPF5 [Frankliniella fusca]